MACDSAEEDRCSALDSSGSSSTRRCTRTRSCRFREARHRPAHVRAARRPLPDPRATCARARRRRSRRARTRSTCSGCTGTTTQRRTGTVAVPEHVVLPPALTGVEAPIVVALGDRFPMIARAQGAGRLRLPGAAGRSPGQFDPTRHRAIWPSTGNYCRGGVAISRIMGCRGVAVLPEGMSRERFDWLERWVADPADIIRTPGTESNVKEIYDKCAELDRRPGERDLQPVLRVREPPRPLPRHRARRCERVFEAMRDAPPGLRLRGVHLGDRLGRHHRGRRLPEGALRRP